jgi:hypothetical protein
MTFSPGSASAAVVLLRAAAREVADPGVDIVHA